MINIIRKAKSPDCNLGGAESVDKMKSSGTFFTRRVEEGKVGRTFSFFLSSRRADSIGPLRFFVLSFPLILLFVPVIAFYFSIVYILSLD